MFPNPQDALPEPARLSLEQYRKLAKDLVKACKSGQPDSIRQWAAGWVRNLVQQSGLEITRGLPVEIERWIEDVTGFATRTLRRERHCVLADAQFVIARSHGFASWPTFVTYVEEASVTSATAAFEAAADAIVTGDSERLRQLLRENPGLVRQRSTREHHATLLHYTAANGVEGYRQKTPQNIVEMAELLLRSGAEVDAEADVYGGGSTTLGLAATSVHPEVAGVQEALLRLLVDHGAQIEKPNMAGSSRGAVLSSLANGRVRAAVFFATRGAKLDLEESAGVGRLDAVQRYFDRDGALLPSASKEQLQRGFLWACMYGWEDVAMFLLDHGADLLDAADSGATGLHWAAGGGYAGIVQRLLARGAPLEGINRWGGTVLEHAGHGFEHGSADADFAPVFETLLAAGATIRGAWLGWIEGLKNRSDEEKKRVSEVFRRYGATR